MMPCTAHSLPLCCCCLCFSACSRRLPISPHPYPIRILISRTRVPPSPLPPSQSAAKQCEEQSARAAANWAVTWPASFVTFPPSPFLDLDFSTGLGTCLCAAFIRPRLIWLCDSSDRRPPCTTLNPHWDHAALGRVTLLGSHLALACQFFASASAPAPACT